jgi:hypothetical protein
MTKQTGSSDSRFFQAAKEYLLSFEQVTEAILDSHLNAWRNGRRDSMPGIMRGMLESLSNRRSMGSTIGKIGSLSSILHGFRPDVVHRKYGNDWEKLFDSVKDSLTPPGRMVRSNSHSYWVIFCKGTVSAARFLSKYPSIEEFNSFVGQLYLNEDTRPALPFLLEAEVHGLGFALACDFLKENGYPKFVKPDVHLVTISTGLGLSHNGASHYEVFKDVVRYAEAIGEVPYVVDKAFWLVGSGNFYLNDIKVRTDRAEFIRRNRP